MPRRPGFLVENAPNVGAHLDIAEPDALDFNLLGNQRYGVLWGCEVGVTGSSWVFDVAYGAYLVNGQVAVGGGQVNLPNSLQDSRFDLIVGDSAGYVSAIVGTPSPNPVFPDYDDKVTVFAAVLIPPGTTPPTQDQVTDKRVMVMERFVTAINDGALLSNQDYTTLAYIFRIWWDGRLEWGGDTWMERVSPGVLRIIHKLMLGELDVGGDVYIGGDLTVIGSINGLHIYSGHGDPNLQPGLGRCSNGDLYKDIDNGDLWVYQISGWNKLSTDVIPPGMTMTGFTTAAPHGWLLVNGQTVTRTVSGGLWNKFPAWRNVVDQTLTLPDARDCFYAWGQPGERGGNTTAQITLQEAHLPPHKHLQSPTSEAGGQHTHPATTTPGGGHTHLTSDAQGAHTHRLYDPGHHHPVPDTWRGPSSGYLLKVPPGTGLSGYTLGNQDVVHELNTGENVNAAGQGLTNLQILSDGSSHQHSTDNPGDHAHTVSIGPGGGTHSHPITENTVGDGVALDIRPPFMGMWLYIKT